jgi:hypothetical protein
MNSGLFVEPGSKTSTYPCSFEERDFMSVKDQDLMLQAIEKELSLNQINDVLWNKAAMLSEGDASKRRENYIKLRMQAMQETVKSHVLKEIKADFARKMAKPADFLSAKDLFKK